MNDATGAEGERGSRGRSLRRRWPWIVLAAIAVILVGVVVALPRLLDPERYRDHIERALGEATGWDAELGALDLSVWGGLALTVTPASLASPGAGSRLDIERIAVMAEIAPLLRGELVIKRIDLVRPEIRLVRRSLDDGWDLPRVVSPRTGADGDEPGLGGPARGPPEPASPGNPAETAGDDESSVAVTIDALRVREGDLILEDRTREPPLVIGLGDVTFDLSPALGDLEGHGDLRDGGRLSFDGRIGETIVFGLDAIPTELFLPFLGQDLLHAGGVVSGEIQAAPPGKIGGRLTGERILLMDGERPFDTLAAEFELRNVEHAWTLDRLHLAADGATIEGGGPLAPELALRLRLTPTPLETALNVAAAVVPLPLELGLPGSVEADLSIDRPAGGRLGYDGKGKLSAASFSPGEMLPDLRDVRAEFTLERAGSLEIRVLEGNVAGGPLRGVARVDPLIPAGKLSFTGDLREAALGELLGGLVHEAVQRVAGPTALDARMTLDLGREVFDARSIGGRLDLDSRRVDLPGWDLEGGLRRGLDEKLASLSGVSSLVQKHLGLDDGSGDKAPAQGGGAEPAAEQLLDSLGATVDFDRFPWGLERFEVAAGDLDAGGHGTFDPVGGVVELQLVAHLNAAKTAELVERTHELRVLVGQDGRLTVPLALSGPLLRPSLRFDLDGVLADQLEQEKDKAIEGLLKGLLDRD